MAFEKAISLPFSIDTFGSVGTTTEQSKVWADRVRSVLGTSLRERVMRPTFGTLIPFSLFNNVENAVVEIKEEVTRAFSRQLKLLTLKDTFVEQDFYTNSLKVTVTYSLPNQETNKTSIGFVIVRGTLPIYEELQ
jgi:phage baseplate assembly protein W